MLDGVIRKILERIAVRALDRFLDACDRCRETQRSLLLDHVRAEQRTAFGRDHHFDEIRSVADFRKRVPITDYSYHQPYIDRVRAGEVDALFHRAKLVMFALTSGTTSARKFIPVTNKFVDIHRLGWYRWGLSTFRAYPPLLLQGKFNMGSDPSEFLTDLGVPCGSISGLTARLQNPLIRRTYVLPAELSKVYDTPLRQYMMWRLGLLHDTGMWVTPNPSTHLSLARFGDRHKERLIRDIAHGSIDPEFAPLDFVLNACGKRLAPNLQRARQLEQIVERTGRLLPKDAWPGLKLLACWTGGTVSSYLRFFPEYFGDAGVRDIGLVASEARMTICFEDRTPSGVLDIPNTFFEFVPVDEIDSPQPTVLEAHEIVEGRDYYILLTTASGLYRYNIHDVVRCTGMFRGTPTIAFLNKGRSISSITGEKLSEFQVVQAVERALVREPVRLSTYALAPCWDDETPYYGLFVERHEFASELQAEQLAAEIDAALRQCNIEYDTKRESDRLGSVRAELLPAGTWECWDRRRQKERGGTAEQYKHPCLIPDMEFAAEIRAESVLVR